MDRRTLRLLTLFLVLFSTGAQADIFQWQDASGKLHFGDRPPEGAQTKTITPNISPQLKDLEIHVKRQDFTLTGDLQQHTLDNIRHIYQRYRRDFGLDLHGTAEVNVFLIEKQDDFQQWMVERIGSSSRHYAGVFIPATNEVAVWKWAENEQQVAQTILHESSHVLLYQLSPSAPVWLQEGLAQYFQTLETQPDGRQRISALPDAQKRIQTWVEQQRLITLRQYLSLDDAQWRKMAHQLNAIPYTVAWATTAFLMSKPVGRSILRQLLQDLEKNHQKPTLQRIDHLYPGGLSRLEYDFFRWAQSDMTPHWY